MTSNRQYQITAILGHFAKYNAQQIFPLYGSLKTSSWIHYHLADALSHNHIRNLAPKADPEQMPTPAWLLAL